jgi:poly(3-hydroxybutyrate) depolymerase
VEDYTLYVTEFMRHSGPTSTSWRSASPRRWCSPRPRSSPRRQPEAQPRSLILVGGPIDPDANATDVTDFGRRTTMGVLEQTVIQQVGFKYRGVGRMVYPGLLQLASFMSMNAQTHSQSFVDQIFRVAKGDASDHDKHNAFYDEYLAVMDMTAEFYLSTVERVFKGREIARNAFSVAGRAVDIGASRPSL